MGTPGKLTPVMVDMIRTSGLSARELARLFGVSTTAIYLVRKGRNHHSIKPKGGAA